MAGSPVHGTHLPEQEKPFRVHFYDPKRKGTWIAKFDTRPEAEEFAKGKTVWGRACKVEVTS